MTRAIPHWIDGAPTAGTSGRTSTVFNPATGLPTAHVQLASADDVSAAVASAKAAATDWRAWSLSRRSAVLFAFRELLAAHADELAAHHRAPVDPRSGRAGSIPGQALGQFGDSDSSRPLLAVAVAGCSARPRGEWDVVQVSAVRTPLRDCLPQHGVVPAALGEAGGAGRCVGAPEAFYELWPGEDHEAGLQQPSLA